MGLTHLNHLKIYKNDCFYFWKFRILNCVLCAELRILQVIFTWLVTCTKYSQSLTYDGNVLYDKLRELGCSNTKQMDETIFFHLIEVPAYLQKGDLFASFIEEVQHDEILVKLPRLSAVEICLHKSEILIMSFRLLHDEPSICTACYFQFQ